MERTMWPPYVGLAFYKRRRKNNVTTFTAIFLRKVQFSEPTENGNTKGGTTEFQTPTIEGKAYPLEITVAARKRIPSGKRLPSPQKQQQRLGAMKWLRWKALNERRVL